MAFYQERHSDHPHEAKEILDEEFQRYLETVRLLMMEIRRAKDRQIIGKYIKKCCALKETNIDVKKNRNEFFKYFLKMVHTAAKNQPITISHAIPGTEKNKKKNNDKVEAFWSNDERTYISAKAMSGVGTLIYMAVSYDLTRGKQGWVQNGFKDYAF